MQDYTPFTECIYIFKNTVFLFIFVCKKPLCAALYLALLKTKISLFFVIRENIKTLNINYIIKFYFI